MSKFTYKNSYEVQIQKHVILQVSLKYIAKEAFISFRSFADRQELLYCLTHNFFFFNEIYMSLRNMCM